MQYWSAAERKWVIEPGTFDLWVGADSVAPLHATFKIR
ncbi:MAG: fibronectin type III-like domain-contianing protein [Pyrinomonadaceae bacterium]